MMLEIAQAIQSNRYPNGPGRRRGRRIRCAAQVRLLSTGGACQGQVLDISSSGALVRVDCTLDEGTDLVCQFTVPSGRATLYGRVSRVASAEMTRLAIEFVRSSQASRPTMVAHGLVARPARPPLALPDEQAFLEACNGCGLCGVACGHAIGLFKASEVQWGPGTPYIIIDRTCLGCLRCSTVCPTGALQPPSHAGLH